MTTSTPAEIIAEAEANAAAQMAIANAQRLIAAQAAQDKLNSAPVTSLLNALTTMAAESVDDLPRPLGQPSPEGTKQSLQRIVAALENGRALVARRVEQLSPAPTPNA